MGCLLAAVNSRLNAPKRLQVLRACGRFGVIVRVLSNAQESRYCLVGALGLPVPTLSSDSANQRDSKNQIVEKLECLNDSSQSYALYLPANYTPDRKWPILYALDPGARGKTPVEHFKEAAEKYGWILAGSNNSRNGPWRRAAEAWSAMTKDMHQRFSIDDDLVYATSFSGGARMAIQIAQRFLSA